jgi:hypothetical protein
MPLIQVGCAELTPVNEHSRLKNQGIKQVNIND